MSVTKTKKMVEKETYHCDKCKKKLTDKNTGDFTFIMYHNTASYDKKTVVGYENVVLGDYCKTCIKVFVDKFQELMGSTKLFTERYERNSKSLEEEVELVKSLKPKEE